MSMVSELNIPLEIPDGWYKMLDQMCDDIQTGLLKSPQPETPEDKFDFLQIKEKFGEMRVYTVGSTAAIDEIIRRYEYVSNFVCCICGQPATRRTIGYILPYCHDCWNTTTDNTAAREIAFNPVLVTKNYSSGTTITKEYDCSDIWNRLFPPKKED